MIGFEPGSSGIGSDHSANCATNTAHLKKELNDDRKNIPGEPGKDYPIYSIDILKKINPGMFGGSGSKPSPAPAQQVVHLAIYAVK